MPETSPIQPGRLREAREYLGLTREDVAKVLPCPPQFIESLENGTTGRIKGKVVRRLMKLYRRPLWWLCGETRFQPSQDTLRKVENLTPGDREAVLDFMEFLQDAGAPPSRKAVPRPVAAPDGTEEET